MNKCVFFFSSSGPQSERERFELMGKGRVERLFKGIFSLSRRALLETKGGSLFTVAKSRGHVPPPQVPRSLLS